MVERYRIEHELGSGGTSTVYLATHTLLGRQVAIKALHTSLRDRPDARARYARDAVVIAKLRGDHVCRLESFGHLPDGEPYMVLEYLDGRDLAAELERGGPMSIARVAEYALQATMGLAEAHARHIVHRDIKPSNLFVVAQPDGAPLVKVIDFGIAKLPSSEVLTRTGATLGSVPFMAPEQLRSSRDVDARADIWSLGVTMHQLATGALPFQGQTSADLAVRIWTEPPNQITVAPAFDQIVGRCLAKDVSDRFRDIAELARALAPLADNGSAAADRTARILSTVQ
jgi:serine/threonine protein kinase